MAYGEKLRIRLVEWINRSLPSPVRKAIDDVSGHDLFLHAAGLGFYALVSLAPLAITAMWLTSMVAGESRVEKLADILGQIAPKDLGADQALRRVADQGTSLGVAAAISGLWPATAYGSGLARAFRRLSPGNPPQQLRGLWGRILVVFVLLPVFVMGTMLGAFAATSLFGEGVARVAGWVLALAVAFVGVALATAAIYRIFPVEVLPWSKVLKGTAFTAVTVAVLTLLFTIAVGMGGNFEERYAASGLAGIVLLAVWLFLSNALLLLGYRVARER